MTRKPPEPDPFEAAIAERQAMVRAELREQAARLGPLDEDMIRGIERVTGERYDPDTGQWGPGGG